MENLEEQNRILTEMVDLYKQLISSHERTIAMQETELEVKTKLIDDYEKRFVLMKLTIEAYNNDPITKMRL